MDESTPPPEVPPQVGARGLDGEPAPLQINVDGASSRRAFRSAPKHQRSAHASARWTTAAAVLVAMALCAVGIAWLSLRPAGFSSVGPPPPGAAIPVGNGAVPVGNGADAAAARPTVVAGEAQAAAPTPLGMQWQSPTAGEPLDRSDTPPGVQMLLALRPRDWLASDAGRQTVAGLRPLAAWPAALARPGDKTTARHEGNENEQVDDRNPLANMVPRSVNDLDRLLIGCWEDRAGALQFALVAEAVEPFVAAELAALDLDGAPNDAGLLQRDGWGWWLPPRHGGRRLVAAPAEEMRQIVAQQGAAPELRRDLAELVEHADQARHATLLVSRDFWTVAGSELAAGPRSVAGAAVMELLGDDWQAALMSVHWDANWFCELRLAARPESPAAKRAARLSQDLASQPARAAERVAAKSVTYGRELLARLPLMVESWQRQTRVSVEGRHVLARSYLPAVAAHNFAWGFQLLTLDDGQQMTPAPSTASSPSSSPPHGDEPTVAERLRETTSLSFPRSTLEGALETLSQQLRVPIEIVGRDLQLEGITKNQSFGLEARDVSAAEILKKILRQASPDGKLVYVVGVGPRGAATIFVTTRAAAELRGETFESAAPTP